MDFKLEGGNEQPSSTENKASLEEKEPVFTFRDDPGTSEPTGSRSFEDTDIGSYGSSSTSSTSDTGSYGGGYGGGRDDGYDDFSDLEEDTVYIADRYNNNYIDPELKNTNTAHFLQDEPKNTFFWIHIGLFLGGLLMWGLGMKLVATGSITGSMLGLGGRLMCTVGEVFAVIDAIYMTTQGSGGVSLIVSSIMLIPLYWFRRVKASFALAFLAIMILAIGLMFSGTFASYKDAYEDSGYTTTSSSSVSKEDALACVNNAYCPIGSNNYIVSNLLVSNMTDIECEFVPEKNMTPAYVKVTGNTTLYGRSQKMEVQISVFSEDVIRFREIKIGSKSYADNNAQVLTDMAKNTLPNVSGNLQYTK